MPSPENVLVFFCDQLQARLLSCYGGGKVRTPHLDALAREAAVFEQAYTPTAICSPARASLMTGLYAHRHHMFNNSTPGYSYCEHLRPDVTMLQDWAAAATDCETAYYGKWHIGPAADLFASRFEHTLAANADTLAFGHSSHWKLVWNLSDRSELYDQASDPEELTNRFDDPQCAAEKERLFALLRAEAQRLGDGQVRLHPEAVESREDLHGCGPLHLA